MSKEDIERIEQKMKSVEIQKAASSVKTAPEAARVIQNILYFYDNNSNQLVDAKGKTQKYYIPPLSKNIHYKGYVFDDDIKKYLKEQMKDIYSRK